MYYMLTDQIMRTHNGYQWDIGKWHKIPKEKQGGTLCSESYFHFYDSSLLAVLLNSIHAKIKNPRLFRASVRGKRLTDSGLKFGFTQGKLVKELPLPKVTLTQYMAFCLLCTKEVCKDVSWNEWADNWLNSKDRSIESAEAEDAAEAAARAARAAEAAAWAAEWAAKTTKIDLKKLAKQAMRIT